MKMKSKPSGPNMPWVSGTLSKVWLGLISKLPVAPYNKAIPKSMMPVENAPMRKYFNEASLPFKFFLSEPVRIYNGIDMISTPRNNISSELKDDNKLIPQSAKNTSA